jgi:hypothetical protein
VDVGTYVASGLCKATRQPGRTQQRSWRSRGLSGSHDTESSLVGTPSPPERPSLLHPTSSDYGTRSLPLSHCILSSEQIRLSGTYYTKRLGEPTEMSLAVPTNDPSGNPSSAPPTAEVFTESSPLPPHEDTHPSPSRDNDASIRSPSPLTRELESQTSPTLSRNEALKQLNLGADPAWPDESSLLKRISRLESGSEVNELQWKIKNRQMTKTDSALLERCVLTIRTAAKKDVQNSLDETDQITSISITSSHLQKILRGVIDFYPGCNLNQDPLIFNTPFAPLFQFQSKLEEVSRKLSDGDDGFVDIRVLLLLCEKYLTKLFGSMRRTLAAGEVTFNALTCLYRPGSLLLFKDPFDQLQCVMCLVTKYSDPNDIRNSWPTGARSCQVTTWYVAWEPSLKRFKRNIRVFDIKEFLGAGRVAELSVYPFEFYGDEASRAGLREKLIARGRRWRSLITDKPGCWMHDGPAITIRNSANTYGGIDEKHLPINVRISNNRSVWHSCSLIMGLTAEFV